ncbi:MAG: sulfite exporter TauE/SafE family protein [bacterium]
MKQYTFHITGTHCASCKILIEDILQENTDIQKSSVHIKKEILSIDTDSDKTPEEIIFDINQKIQQHGYVVSLEKPLALQDKKQYEILWTAIPIGLVFLVLFFMLQKSGILNLGIGGTTTPSTSFIIGLIASVSSCLAIVGGLILSLSTSLAQDEKENTKRAVVLFHVGRIIGFGLLGGLLGMIGGVIGISFTFSAILGLIAASIMIVLGLNLIGVFRKSSITLPAGIFTYFRKIEHTSIAPIVIGVGTFFLPCGFTQSMQFAALSSGSFLGGMGIMLGFALGTLPVLSMLSFSSVGFAKSKHAPLFFASAGVVVIGLGLFALLAGLAGLGIISPLFTI